MIDAALKPGFCCFGITDACMLRCKMCDKWKGDLIADISTNRPPTLEEWKRCADSLRQMVDEHFIIDIGGGEALMMAGVLELVRYSVDLGFDTSIASNGWLIDEDMAKRIADSGLKMISLSLDSHKPEVHDFLRGVPGVYQRVIDAIGHLHKYCARDFSINICCAIYEINQGDIMELIKWANSDNKIVGSINFMACMQPNNTPPEEDWYLNKYNYLWPKDPEKTAEIIEKIIDLKKK
ncbi:MAG: radical SAM protein [Candidatus Omnitrophica bacterium]|nr:radical SAM protein [Candidatus Omnitrophota bacterium]